MKAQFSGARSAHLVSTSPRRSNRVSSKHRVEVSATMDEGWATPMSRAGRCLPETDSYTASICGVFTTRVYPGRGRIKQDTPFLLSVFSRPPCAAGCLVAIRTALHDSTGCQNVKCRRTFISGATWSLVKMIQHRCILARTELLRTGASNGKEKFNRTHHNVVDIRRQTHHARQGVS
jgi:hypothetical protein